MIRESAKKNPNQNRLKASKDAGRAVSPLGCFKIHYLKECSSRVFRDWGKEERIAQDLSGKTRACSHFCVGSARRGEEDVLYTSTVSQYGEFEYFLLEGRANLTISWTFVSKIQWPSCALPPPYARKRSTLKEFLFESLD